MKLFHAQLILCKLIDTSEGGGVGGGGSVCFSPSHNSYHLEGGKKERERDKGVKD